MKRETARGLYAIMESLEWLALGALIFFLLVSHASGSAVCLTKKEARSLWPRQHIYWYSSNHCWSNRRGGAPRNLRYDLIRENHAQSLPQPSVIMPEVRQVIPWLDPKLYTPKEATLSFRLLDIDELTSKTPDPPECCWPELEPDGKGNWTLKGEKR